MEDQIIKKGTDTPQVNQYSLRNKQRQYNVEQATVSMVNWFISKGSTTEQAYVKVQQLSNEVAINLYIYVLGNTQPLIDSVNNSLLYFMDAETKEYLVSLL